MVRLRSSSQQSIEPEKVSTEKTTLNGIMDGVRKQDLLNDVWEVERNN
jgi:hypothetical protein